MCLGHESNMDCLACTSCLSIVGIGLIITKRIGLFHQQRTRQWKPEQMFANNSLRCRWCLRSFLHKFDFGFRREAASFMKYGALASDALPRHIDLGDIDIRFWNTIML